MGFLSAAEGSGELVLEICTVDDYLEFVASVNSGNTYKNEYVNLYADLDFAGVDGELICGSETESEIHFEGTFDGNGYHLKNMELQSETEAGLFRNLEGIVCNLELEGGSITGETCGAIASTLSLGGYIVNCASSAQINGNTVDGIVGQNNSEVRNCCWTLDEEQASVETLNQELGGLGSSYGVDGWYCWEEKDGEPSLTQKQADTITSIEIGVAVDLQRMTLQAYYSETEGAWCFAIPSGCTELESRVYVTFVSGDTLLLECGEEGADLSFAHDRIAYTLRFLETSNVPVLMLDLTGGADVAYLNEDKENMASGTFTLLGSDGVILANGALERIRGRGNDSWRAAKRSYGLKFSEEQDLFGIGSSQNYVLLAGYRGNSLAAYKVTYDLAGEIGMDYAPESEFVHLYVEGEYLGMYLLTGKIEVGEERFDLVDLEEETQKVNSWDLELYELETWYDDDSYAARTWYHLEASPEDVTGGYILEMDNVDYDPTDSNFVSERLIRFVLSNITEASQEEVEYIAEFWQDFEDALYSEDGYNEKGKYYTEYIDLESFADQWLIYELNMENSVSSSVYYYKDSDKTGDGRLHAVWEWDAEHSLTANSDYTWSWFASQSAMHMDDYWMQFYSHEDFAEIVYKEWTEKFVPAIEKALGEMDDTDTDGLRSLDWYLEAYAMDGEINESRWAERDFETKMERIRTIYTGRKDFLTRALSLYDSGYRYFYEEDGVFYGVTEEGEAVALP
ncbi:MAG: CotH kinase family protein [Lachnospiraceae bacterium]|nr:CotH kinase family protein [Lachnospiraceae bacterium]